MKLLHSFLIFTLSMIFCLFCTTAQGKTDSNDSEKPKRKVIKVKIGKPIRLPDGTIKQKTIEIDVTNPLSEEAVDKYIEEVKKFIKEEKKGEKAPSIDLDHWSARLFFFSYHPELEEVTNINKFWYREISSILKKMAMTKDQSYLPKIRKDRKKRAELVKRYKAYFKKLEYLLENPKEIEETKKKRKTNIR